MIAVDTNVLVHAHRRDAPAHDVCAGAVRQLAEGRRAWAIPWPCAHEFLAVTTHPRIFDPPSSLPAALDQVSAWADSPTCQLLSESGDHLAALTDVLADSGAVGPRVHDARVAALCRGHAVERLVTLDRDFSRFPRLETARPHDL